MAIAVESGRASSRPAWRDRLKVYLRKHRQAVEAWIILTPILAYFTIFSIIPVFADLYVSFTRWNGVMGSPTWVGFANYRRLFTPLYRLIIFNTLLIASVILTVRTGLGFFIALLLNTKVKGRGLFRALWYIPTLTAAAVTATVFVVFLNPFDGMLNNTLRAVGLEPIIWTMSGGWMRFFVVLFTLWRSVGTAVVLFLAALQGIHQEIYEAAMVDGASTWDQIRFVTVPLLRPMITFVLITGMVNAIQIFESVKVMTDGGPRTQDQCFDATNLQRRICEHANGTCRC